MSQTASFTFILCAAFTSLLHACKSTEHNLADSTSLDATTGMNSSGQFELSKDDEQSLYLKMLTSEVQAGVLVAKDKLHTTFGVIDCTETGANRRCRIQTVLNDRNLSSDQELDGNLSQKIWTWSRNSRPELDIASQISLDVQCVLLGKKSPPYDLEDVTCKISKPLLPGEAWFDSPLADVLIDALSGNRTSDSELISGNVSCQIIVSSGRKACTLRPLLSGMQAERIIELGTQHANSVFYALKQSYTKAAAAAASTAAPVSLPTITEIPATLSCSRKGASSVCRSRVRY